MFDLFVKKISLEFLEFRLAYKTIPISRIKGKTMIDVSNTFIFFILLIKSLKIIYLYLIEQKNPSQ